MDAYESRREKKLKKGESNFQQGSTTPAKTASEGEVVTYVYYATFTSFVVSMVEFSRFGDILYVAYFWPVDTTRQALL